MMSQLKILTLLGSLSLFGVACNAGDQDGAFDNLELDASPDVKADQYTKNIGFDVIDADLGVKAGKAGRWLVTSKASYENFFKTKAPTGVKWGQEWVYIYAAGTKSTGGYKASISQITFNKKNDNLRFFDALESPGPACIVTYAFTTPSVAVKFKKQGYDALKYTHEDATRSCEDPCNLIDCAPGYTCQLQDVVCVTTPCDPVPECVPVKGPGCAATLCAQGTNCVEDENGNAECVPVTGCAAMLCGPYDICVEDAAGNGTCKLADPCMAMKCAAGTICTSTGIAKAACIKPPACGGFAGIQCKSPLECVDSPFDSCDPDNGGADCGGICQCTILAKCAAGYEFNKDPAVCGCVKATN